MPIDDKKNAIGEIISTVLIILLIMFATAILVSFLLPFLTESLIKTKCINYNGKIYISDNPNYNCYNLTEKKVILQIKFDGSLDKKDAESIVGIKVLIRNQSVLRSFDIVPLMSNPSINNGGVLFLPRINEERTYSISNVLEVPEEIMVYPILKDQNCTSSVYTQNFIRLC